MVINIFSFRENAESQKPPHALLFKNAKCCHAIFDFLLNWTDPKVEIRAQGPPKLVSNGPFLGASISQCIPSKPMFIIQGDKSITSEMKIKSLISKSTNNQEDSAGLWSATIKNGNVGLCPLMNRDFSIHAAKIFDEQITALENPVHENYQLEIIFENDSDVSSFKGGNVFDGTLPVNSLIYSKGKFQLNTL